MELRNLPRELLLEIIAKQNCVEYLTTEECAQIVERCKGRMVENSIREFKNKFLLQQDFYQHINTLYIESGENGSLVVEFNDTDYLYFYKSGNVVTCSHYPHYGKNYDTITQHVRSFKEIASVDVNDTYEFFNNLLIKNKENICNVTN
jgi:hypothetical protein